MRKETHSRAKSPIIIGEDDHARLIRLADTIANRNGELSDILSRELERAKVLADRRVPASVVRMGSSVTYHTETGDERRVTLVFPAEADISAGKVSILTPIGIALLGLSPGQTMEWLARDGRKHTLTVLTVEAPASP